MKSQYDIERMKYNDLNGSVALPSYQRKLVWSEGQIKGFIDNISRGFPFGSILLYRYEGQKQLSLIDGLQRFNALRRYEQEPSRYFTGYQSFLDDILASIEKGGGITLTPDQRSALSTEIESILRKTLTEGLETPIFLRDEITKNLAIYPTSDEWKDHLINLQAQLKKESEQFLDLDDLLIPCIVYTGSEEDLPDVFANLNQGGTKLSKYQVLAAQWTAHQLTVPDSDTGTKLLNNVIARYQNLIDRRGLEILDFDSAEMENTRQINLSEYCYALGELIAEQAPAFWSGLSAVDNDKREDTINLIGYLSAAIALGVDNRTITKLPTKMPLLESEPFIGELTESILKEYETLQREFEKWLTIPGVENSCKFESNAITNMQVLSFFASLWHKRYRINDVKPSLETIEHYRNKGYDQIRENLIAYCLADVASRYWQGSGDSRLASYYVKNVDSPNSYYVPLTPDGLSAKLAAWHEDATAKGGVNVDKTSKLLLCVHAAPHRNEYTGNKYDIEHVIAKNLLSKDRIYDHQRIPGGTLGNLMYLKEKTNRGKKARNLYSLLDHEGVELKQSYLDLICYPSRTQIDNAEDALGHGSGEQAASLIIQRGKEMIQEIAKAVCK